MTKELPKVGKFYIEIERFKRRGPLLVFKLERLSPKKYFLKYKSPDGGLIKISGLIKDFWDCYQEFRRSGNE